MTPEQPRAPDGAEYRISVAEWNQYCARMTADDHAIRAMSATIDTLRAGIAELRIDHQAECWEMYAGATCDCGADEHNARIDALLAET